MQTRLYSKGRILGHKRGKRNSRPNQSLVAIEGVDTKEAARAYLGKVGQRLDLSDGTSGHRDAEAGPGWARIQAGGYEDEVDIIGTKDDDEQSKRKMCRGGPAQKGSSPSLEEYVEEADR